MANSDGCDGNLLTLSEMRNLHLAGTVRIPRGWDVGQLSLRKRNGSSGWTLQVVQDRGGCVERRIIRVEDVVVMCLVRGSFRKMVDDFQSRTRQEDWDEWNNKCSRHAFGDVLAKSLEQPKKMNKKMKKLFERLHQPARNENNKKKIPAYGVVFIKETVSVLTEAEFGLPASESAQWQSPIPPSAVRMAAGPFC